MGRSPQCTTISVQIGQLVPEKIFEGFSPYMGVAAILVMCHQQTFVPHTHGGSTQKLALTGQAVLEKKMIEIVDDGWTPDHCPGASTQVSLKKQQKRPSHINYREFHPK